MAKLIIFSGTPQAREFELQPGANRVGRGEANDFQIQDASVSTHHAEIIVEGSSIRIQDLGSTNGTFINHAKVGEGILQPGQPLRLGGVEIILQAEASAAVPVTAPVEIQVKASSPPPPPAPRAALRLSGAHTTPSAPPPEVIQEDQAVAPVAAAADLTVFAEPPPGKTACKFHPKIGGQWLCQKCSELFCPLCVGTKSSSEGTLHTCRKCGTVCVPVKPRRIVTKEKQVVVYSQNMLLVRSVGFGFVAAILGAMIWIGLSYLFGFDVPFIFGPIVGALCGYAVKLASQDTPSPVFSGIAVVFCILGSLAGKLGMIAVTHLTIYTGTSLLTSGLGICLAIYAAWKIGGSD